MFARSHRIVPGVLLGFLLAVAGWAEEKNPGAASPEQCLSVLQKAIKAGDAKALESVCTANMFGSLLPPGTKNPVEHLKKRTFEFSMAYSFLERQKGDLEVKACQNHGNNAFATTTYLTFQNVNGHWYWSHSEMINF